MATDAGRATMANHPNWRRPPRDTMESQMEQPTPPVPIISARARQTVHSKGASGCWRKNLRRACHDEEVVDTSAGGYGPIS
eukprot:4467442-Pyramimonas_sp.AAC.1